MWLRVASHSVALPALRPSTRAQGVPSIVEGRGGGVDSANDR